MASLAAEDKVEFLIQLLVTGEFTPNYSALAKKMGINTNSNAQRRLKGIVEADKRFVLRSAGTASSIVESGKASDEGTDPDATKDTPPSTKGRKRNRPKADEGDGDETPSKSTKKSRMSHVQKASTKNLDDDDSTNQDGDELAI